MIDYLKDFQFKEKKIAEYSTELCSNIQKIVPKKPNEADFRHKIDQLLEKFCAEVELNPLSRM